VADNEGMGRVSTLIAATREVLDTRDLSTGLLKRHAFERQVDNWIGGGDARRPATTLLMIQVGIAGQPLAERPDRQHLMDLARSVEDLLRATDIAGHVDDDTIGVLLPSTPVDPGLRAAERILESFRSTAGAQNEGLVATIGISGAGNLEPWLAALQALREARLAGGDRAIVAPERYSGIEHLHDNDPPVAVVVPERGSASPDPAGSAT
jgi:hypothetical protein